MKMISHISELKKGDTVIIKNARDFESRGLMKVTGDVFTIDFSRPSTTPRLTIKCNETASIEEVNLDHAKIFLIQG